MGIKLLAIFALSLIATAGRTHSSTQMGSGAVSFGTRRLKQIWAF